MLMTFAAPTLPQCPSHLPDSVTLRLSTLTDTLLVSVPDSSFYSANWSVYPIFGTDPENPDWAGEEVDTGVWDDASDDMLKLTDIELHIPKVELARYLNSEIELRYKFQDESSQEPFSPPLKLRIQA